MKKDEKYYHRLRDLREDRDLTQAQLAEILLADYYNVSLDYITGRTNDKRGIGYKK